MRDNAGMLADPLRSNVSLILSLLTMSLGLGSLLHLKFQIFARIDSVLFQQPVAFMSALILTLTGAVLAMGLWYWHAERVRIFSQIFLSILCLLSTIVFIESALRTYGIAPFNIEAQTASLLGLGIENADRRISPISSGMYVIVQSIALLSLSRVRLQMLSHWLPQMGAGIVFVVATFFVTAHVFGAPLFAHEPAFAISLPTSVGILLLSCIILFFVPQGFLHRLFRSKSLYAAMMQITIPLITAIILLQEYLRLHYLADLTPASRISYFTGISFLLMIVIGIIIGKATRHIESLASRAQHNLEEAEQKQRTLAETKHAILHTMADGLCIIDEHGHILEVNDAFCSMLDYDRLELLDKMIGELEIDSSYQSIAGNIDSLLQFGSDGYSSRLVKKSGTMVDVEVSISRYSQSVTQIVCIFRDISHRKRTEELLGIEHQLHLKLASCASLDEAYLLILRAALDIGPFDCGGIYVLDAKTNTLELLHHHGLSDSFVREKSRFGASSPQMELIKAGKPIFADYNRLPVEQDQVDPTEGLLAVCIVPVIINNELLAVLNVASHVSHLIPPTTRSVIESIAFHIGDSIHRLRTEETLRKSEEKLNSIFRTSPIGIGLLVDRRIQEINEEFTVMTGYSRDELIDQPTRVLYRSYEEFHHVGGTLFHQIREHGSGTVESVFRRKDGSCFDVMISCSPVDGEDRLKGYTFAVVDISENKRNQQKLEHVNSLLTATLNAIDEGIALTDLGGTVITSNNKLAELWNVPQRGSIAYTIPDLKTIAASEAHDPKRLVQRVTMMLGHPEQSFGEEIPLKDGRTLLLVSTPHKMNEELVGRVWSFRDISQQKRAEEILRLRIRLLEYSFAHTLEELLQRTVDEIENITGSNLGFYHFLQPDQKTLSVRIWSTRTREFFGGAPRFEVPADLNEVGLWADCIRRRAPIIFNDSTSILVNTLFSDKNDRITRAAAIPLIRNGKVVAVLGVANKQHPYTEVDVDTVQTISELIWDICQRKQAELDLQSSERRFRTLIDASPMAILVMQEGRFVYVNKSAFSHTGYTEAELLALSPYALIHPESVENTRKRMAMAEQGTPTSMVETKIIGKDGRQQINETLVIPIDFGGKPALLVIAQDITEKKELQAQLSQAQKMESLGQLAGGVAHDFNNILAIIMGHADLLERQRHQPERITHHLQTINDATKRASEIVAQILTFARKQSFEVGPVDVNVVIRSLIHMLASTLPKTIVVEKQLPDTLPLIQGNATQLHQVLLNLALNSRDAMPSGGNLLFITDVVPSAGKLQTPDAHEYCVRIAVRDSGSGMNEATRLRIFEPFFTTKERGKGTGLGLATAYGIIGKLGGSIDVESVLGEGTTFFLYLPMTDVAADSLNREMTSVALPTEKKTILVVEDEADIREVIVENLQAFGFLVIEAGDGEESLRIYREQWGTIDLVLSDLGLPKLSGSDCFREMKRINPGVKMILATGFIDPSEREHLEEHGLAGVIQKPYKMEVLLNAVSKGLA